MKKKTTAMVRSETLNNPSQEEIQDEDLKIQRGNGFYACYLLTSLCPRFKGHTYIGFTVNPQRRIRQHNGEIRSGAFRTKKRRPWEMVFCIYGFPTNVSALQFEWAWQHPIESLQVRQAAVAFKSFSGVANKIKLAYTMLNLPAWNSLNITVNYFSTKYSNHSAACPSLPDHMRVQVLPMDELPCYTKSREISSQCEDDEFGDDDGVESTKCDIGAIKESLIENTAYREDGSTTPIIDEISREKFEPSNFAYHPPVSKAYYDCIVGISSPIFDPFFMDDREDVSNDEKSTSSGKVDEGKASIKRCDIPHETEVIDLLSPSPDCRVVSERKKRRLSTACFPVIIDLT